MTRAIVEPPTNGKMPPFADTTQWLNSGPLAQAELRSKVVLVSFWTYTCINWLRTLPYIRAWYDKYKDHGLVVIGVHTPEFAFEHDIDNVRRAIKAMGIAYPVAIDNDYAIWSAFSNHYWPALYFVDSDGYIRYHQFGEGEYAMSERVIQQLLTEIGTSDLPHDLITVRAAGPEFAADWEDLESPETYLGLGRGLNFISSTGTALGKSHLYTPPKLLLNQWSLAGRWTVDAHGATCNEPNGRLLYQFHARDVNLVMGPLEKGKAVQFRVLIDGKPPGKAHGADTDTQGMGVAMDQRLYQLVRQPKPITNRLFEIEFLEPGIQALAFTFG